MKIVVTLFLSLLVLKLPSRVFAESTSVDDGICEAHYQYDSLIRLFAASYAIADKQRRTQMLVSQQAFSNEVVKIFNEGLLKNLDENEYKVLHSHVRMLTPQGQGNKEEFRHFDVEWSVDFLISFLEKAPEWNELAQQLDQVNYFDNMGAVSKIGLETIIAHMGMDGLRYHPWLAIPADDEELLEGELSCFLYGINRLALSFRIEQPTVSEFAYNEDGRLVLQLDSSTHTILDEKNFGENAFYHVGANVLHNFSTWLATNGQEESLYSLDGWNDHAAIVLTSRQLNTLEHIVQSRDTDGLELPHKRSLD